MTMSHSEIDERQDKQAKEDHLAQGENDRHEVKETVLLSAQHIYESKEGPCCRQNQGIAQNVTDGRAAHKRCGDATNLSSEHGPDYHEEYGNDIHITAHELSQRPVTSRHHDLQKVRSHSDMSCRADYVDKRRHSNKASTYSEESSQHSGANADNNYHPH